MQVNILYKMFDLLLIPLAAIAIVAVISPRIIVRHLGRPKFKNLIGIEIFLRIAGILMLIGAVINWCRL